MQGGGTASGFDLQVWGSTASSLGCFWKVRVISAHSVSNAVVFLFPDDIFCPGKPSAANCKLLAGYREL